MIIIAVEFESHTVFKVQTVANHSDGNALIDDLVKINSKYFEEITTINNQSPFTASELGITKAHEYRDYMKQFSNLKRKQIDEVIKPCFYGFEFFMF